MTNPLDREAVREAINACENRPGIYPVPDEVLDAARAWLALHDVIDEKIYDEIIIKKIKTLARMA